MDETRPLVFLSHNKADAQAAGEIALFIVAENQSVWFDEWEIQAGDSIVEAVNRGLQDCSHFLIVWSKNAAGSNWVRRELASALAVAIARGVPKIIPILLDDTPLPPLLADIRGIVFDAGSEAVRWELVRAIAGRRPSDSFVRAVVRKYKELTRDETQPLGVKACPECGGIDLHSYSQIDYDHDEMYYFIDCRDCGWSDWSQ